MHSCFCIYILFTDLETKKRRDLQCIFLSCVSFTYLGWRTKKGAASYRFAEYTGHARKMERLLD